MSLSKTVVETTEDHKSRIEVNNACRIVVYAKAHASGAGGHTSIQFLAARAAASGKGGADAWRHGEPLWTDGKCRHGRGQEA